ncbi:hypothetical protein OG539_01110 [Actinacidiphila glaucinigra]|uniref:hypothetical protein n=1 Tax=Actinacidiphila glaucinigra TaxID=235986 RepID=UPI002DD7FA25|nr:hypothetical protein [Actinacidiphila glaucinigra]WSD64956.1 hypothetical protein OIE69_41840 [Actinacidiphila glaucinigra]
MSQQGAQGEFRSQPAREVGQDRHRVIEGIVAVFGDGLGGDGARDRPDQPPAEHRGAVLCGPHDSRQLGIAPRHIREQGVGEQIGPFAQPEGPSC